MSVKKIVIGALVIAGLVLLRRVAGDVFSLAVMQAYGERMLAFVSEHYLLAVAAFMAAYLSTALALPGALALTVLGGYLFGTLASALYVVVAATAGAATAFFLARYVAGESIQRTYAGQLRRFNDEMARHGASYLLVLRIVPLLPFFVVNYLSGLTKIRTSTFLVTTAAGMLPGAVICSFAGRRLRSIKSSADVLTPETILALVLLGVTALLPVAVHHMRKEKG